VGSEWVKRVSGTSRPTTSPRKTGGGDECGVDVSRFRTPDVMPIKGGRHADDGIRAVGLKISGPISRRLRRSARRSRAPPVSGTRNAFAERTGGGSSSTSMGTATPARYGLSIEAAQSGAERDRRRERDHHDRRASVSGERPHARFPFRHRRSRACRAGVEGRRQIPLGEWA
jgi:hypothetical protein